MMKMPASLQGRLLALVLAASLAVWLGAAALSWRDAQHELDELLDSHLAQAAALLVARQAHGDTDDERLDAPSLHRYAPRVMFQVFHEGRLAMRSAQAPASPIVAGEGALQGFHTVTLQGERWRVFAARGAENDVQVFVAERESSRASILGAVLRSTLWPVAVALPLLALAGWWAVRLGLRPLREAARSLARRDPADLSAIEDGGAPTELRTLLGALNSLFARIGALLERERRFTGDAAHELRTPLAAVRAQAQVALGAQDDAQRRHALQATLAGCDRATRVVEQLLTLSRLEAGTAMPLSRVDLAQVTRGVVAQLAPAGLDKQQSIAFDADAGCAVEGDETLLAVLARNALDNAIRYSPHGARIEVAVRREGQDVVLSVEDSGPGLPQDQLRRLGERFFRAAGQAESGSGLGWSILQRIAAAHRGSVHAAASAALGGLAVQARFPAAGRHG